MTEIHSLALLSGGMTLARGIGVANLKALWLLAPTREVEYLIHTCVQQFPSLHAPFGIA
jgi:hypothetical protein